MKVLTLSSNEVAQCIGFKDVIKIVDYVFKEWGKGNIVQPPKITLELGRCGVADSWINAMPSYVVPLGIAGLKWAGGFFDRVKHGRPYLVGYTMLLDPKAGELLALMDGTLISNLRTGASAAVSAKYLAKKKSRILTIVGAGTQGRMAAICMQEIFDLEEIRVVDIEYERCLAFKKDMDEKYKVKTVACADIKTALKKADIVVEVTTARKPFIKNEWLEKGVTVLGMGSFQQTEDDFALQADKIVVDSLAQCLHRGEIAKLCEEGKISEKNIHAELGKIVIGEKTGRKTDQERILMIPVGLGAHDVAVAYHVYQKAQKKGLGKYIELS